MKYRKLYPSLLITVSLAGCAHVGWQADGSPGSYLPANNRAQPSTVPQSTIATPTTQTPTTLTATTLATGDGQPSGAEPRIMVAAVDRTAEPSAEADAKVVAAGYDEASAGLALIPVQEPLLVEESYESLGYSLADIEEMALRNNPAIAAAYATSNKAAGLQQQVGIGANPTMGYFGQQLADENTDQHGLFIEQEFVRGDKLTLNQQVLSHTSSAQRWEAETQKYRVLTDVRVRYYEAVAAQQQLDVIQKFQTVASRGVDVAVERKKAQEGTLIEVLQAKTLLSEVTLAAEQAEVAYRGAWQDLAAIAGLQGGTPQRLVAELGSAVESTDWDLKYAEVLAQSPELAVANALVCEKAALLKRQQVQMVPNVIGQFGAGYDRGTESGMINVQLSAPIPVRNKNAGNISAAYADYTRSIENVSRIEQAIKSRLVRAAQDYDAARASVLKYGDEIIPQATESLELSEQAYRAGELDFLQVLIVRRTFYEATVRFIAAKRELAQADAKVDGLLLTGGLDAPEDYTDGDSIRGQSFGGQ
jgi:outer membrane protein, heavy metal efflux system